MQPGLIIRDIGYCLPEQVVTNDQLRQEHPDWDMSVVEARAGVVQRRVARADETALDLGLRACEALFAQQPEARERIDAILFCTQCPDYLMPPNAYVLHKALGLPENVFALDYSLACSGYPYGLALAQGLLSAGFAKNILLVTADTYSKYIHPDDRSSRVLFGDAAAASWIASEAAARGIIDIQFAASGARYDKFIIPAGGCRMPRSPATALPRTDDSGNVRTLENIRMNGFSILSFVTSEVTRQVKDVLKRNELGADDVALFVFHQASKLALDSLSRVLRLPPEKVYRNLAELGNTVSASIPIVLKDAWTQGLFARGDKLVLCGFGVGLSWSTALIEF